MQPELRPVRSLPGKSFPLSLVASAMLAACGGGQSSDDEATAQARVGAAGEASVCFYERTNYQGASFCTTSNSAWVGASWNDRISSVKVKTGYKVQLFEHINYGGGSVMLTADTPSLVARSFNNKTSSLKITVPSTPPPPPPPAPAPPPPPPPPPPPAPPPAGNGMVAGIQLAQSMLFNSDDKELVLVAGKAALVKVNVTTADTAGAKPTGTLRVDNVSGGDSRDLLLTAPTAAIPAAVPEVPSFSDSYTTFIPAELVKPGLRLTVQIGSGAATTLTPRVGGGVPMRYVPISIKIGDMAGVVPADQSAHLQALFPVSSATTQAHAAYTSQRVTSLPTTDAGWSDAFSKILSELADLHAIEGAARHDHYFGFIPKRTWGLAGLGYVGGNSSVGFDMPSSPATMRDVVAHEMGHNFSLPHAACGGAGSPDPNYPYPDANLGKPGRYIWSFLADSTTFYDPRPLERHDIMSYCGGKVFSDYNYRRMQVYLTPADKATVAGSTSSAQSVSAPEPSTQPREVLLVSGELRASGAELNPVKALMGRASASTTDSGTYTLRVVTVSGIIDYPFTPRELDHDDAVKHFSLTIPNPGTIASITVLYQGKAMGEAKSSAETGTSRAQSATSVTAPQVKEANGQLQVSWDSRRHPFATLTWVGANGQRINLAQDLRGGSALVSAGELPAGGSFEVILSDGLNSTRQSVGR